MCEEVKLNLAYRWFCRLSIEDNSTDRLIVSRVRQIQDKDEKIVVVLIMQFS